MRAYPSACYVGRPRALPFVVAVAFFGWLVFQLLLGLGALLREFYVEIGEPSWADIIGGVIFIPLAFAVCFSLMLGRAGLLQLVALLPQGLQP